MSNKSHLIITTGLSLILGAPVVGAVGETTRVSVSSKGVQADAESSMPAISGNGRFVSFASAATTLAPGKTNLCETPVGPGACQDIYVHDRWTKQTERVSVRSDGAQARGFLASSSTPSISMDGRVIAFASRAPNLVTGDKNTCYLGSHFTASCSDIFVRDRITQKTTRVSVSSAGVEGNSDSDAPSLSADGRWVAFSSWSDNLVKGDGNTNCQDGFGIPASCADVFIHDRKTKQTTLISRASDGIQGNLSSTTPSISADGRWVVFASEADNLVEDDHNGKTDVFLHDRLTQRTTRLSANNLLIEGNGNSFYPVISADGNYVAFASDATNFVADGNDTNVTTDIFLYDRRAQKILSDTPLVNGAAGVLLPNSHPSLSADGRFLAFQSHYMGGLGPKNLTIYDRLTKTRPFMTGNYEGGGEPWSPNLSADGRWIAFTSDANSIVSGDSNGVADVFVHDRLLNKNQSADVGVSQADVMASDHRRTYTINVINHGQDAATQTSLVDQLPSDVLLDSVSTTQGACSRGAVVVCRLGSLAAGAVATVTVTTRGTSTTPNRTYVNAAPYDPRLADNISASAP